MKKLLTILSVFLLIVILAVPAFSAEGNENFNRLLSFGYEEDFLEKLSDSALEKIVSLIGNNEVADVEIKKDLPYIQKSNASGLVLNSVSATLKDPKSGSITGKTVSVYWEWQNKKPLVRCADCISVTWNSENLTYSSDSFCSETYSLKGSAGNRTITEKQTILASAGQDRLGWYVHLPMFSKSFGGFGAFNLLMKAPLKGNAEYDSVLRIGYIHEIKKAVIVVFVFLALVAAAVIMILRRRRKRKAAK